MRRLLFAFFLFSSISGFAQIQFSDISEASAIGAKGPNYGFSFGDYNNDNWEDIYITRIGEPNLLYQNLGNQTFEEVAAEAGVDHAGRSKMAVWGDINNDGWLDLFLTGSRNVKDILYLNNGDGTFEDISATSRMTSGADGLAAMMGDIDNDGLLDIYVARLGSENTLYRNQGDNTFVNIVKSAGATDMGIAMGAIMFDYDNDRDLDIYLVHDNYEPNILYQNDGTGNFTNVAPQANVDHKSFGMGVDVGDVNNDGHLDIYITNLNINTLLLNNGDRTFTDISESADITDHGMGWGIGFYDVDNDGWQDVYLANSLITSNIMYQNLGNNTFLGMSEDTILSSEGRGFGVGGADIDNDGKIDIGVANSNDKIGNQLFLNQSITNNNWLKVKLQGETSNRNGIGARLIAKYEEQVFIDELNAGSSYAGQNSMNMHLGLGKIDQLDSLIVLWPSGYKDVLVFVETNQHLTIKEGSTEIPKGEGRSQKGISVSPNPFNSQLKIVYWNSLIEDVSIEILDQRGSRIKYLDELETYPGQYAVSLETENLKNGFYICVVRIGQEKFYQKIIKN